MAGIFYINSTNAQRIIAAGSAITETVCALGDCDKIIASDRTSLYPSHIQQLPSIGHRSGINAEGILSLKTKLIIAEKDLCGDVRSYSVYISCSIYPPEGSKKITSRGDCHVETPCLTLSF